MQKNTADKIIVENVQDGETVHHSFLLLKITVHHSDCVIDLSSNKHQLEVFIIGNGGARFEPTTLDETHFKCLVELKPDENRIRLGYCCLRASFNIKYLRRETQFEVVPLYVINEGHDGKFQAPETQVNTVESACARILTGCKLLQCFIAEKLATRKTFQIKLDECVVFKSKLRWETALKMAPDELWAELGREIMQSGIGCETKRYFGFVACTRYNGSKYSEQIEMTHDEIVSLTEGYVALGGGGLALLGTACLYTWPESVHEVVKRFEECAFVDRTRFMDDSCYRGTLGACFSTTLGSALHELCHTFGLGHTEDGIMGRGFDNISEFFVSSPPTQTKMERWCPTLNNKNNNYVILKADDGIYFTGSSAALLYYHKFFNNFPDKKVTLAFDNKSKLLKSTAGIRVIEIRDDIHETVIEHWLFPGRILRFSFRIPDSFNDGFVLVVEDNAGNIIKRSL